MAYFNKATVLPPFITKRAQRRRLALQPADQAVAEAETQAVPRPQAWPQLAETQLQRLGSAGGSLLDGVMSAWDLPAALRRLAVRVGAGRCPEPPRGHPQERQSPSRQRFSSGRSSVPAMLAPHWQLRVQR